MRVPHLWRSESGSVAVEFALIVPAFLLLTFGIVDFSRAFYTQNALSSAVREGARFAAVQPSLTETSNLNSVKNHVHDFMQSFGGPEIDVNKVLITTNLCTVTVAISDYPFQPITPIPNWGILDGGPYLITRQATFRWENTACF